ncbi:MULTISPECIES: hypothetical protein [unclassified Lysobacter]|uniref:hypothetical protein n=1 Tax=unclassified Lysobacter TaxID=2635362 RepID=UPI001BE75B4D|nr:MULTISPECIES: hypothetical protein [unclassified Lysobacter]MBT2746635.1 hypothetical protein [Lysobacter sp. ISL-42]MBT2753370.1 hypothetical protein [Lysobacter sp. ISL-50]MBT2775480.1 hypothetical protein [Lysobacter sp. ISL-54]MBT2782984.1 hypothetical protein [Lysobacter sp. ISL-52]
MPQATHLRSAALWIGAIVSLCGLSLLAVDVYLHFHDGVVHIAKGSYFHVQRSSLAVAIDAAVIVLGASLLIWARLRRAG